MNININCQSFNEGLCLHPSAPKSFFLSAGCILLARSADPRIRLTCATQQNHIKPKYTPTIEPETDMPSTDYELTPGQATIIVGPQGSGKSTLAREIATRYGSFVEIGSEQMRNSDAITQALQSEPRTLIIDGFAADEEMIYWLKWMIASESVHVDRLHEKAKVVITPNFIFCTEPDNPFLPSAEDRRFRVIKLPEAA